jgi:hypothetical protein
VRAFNDIGYSPYTAAWDFVIDLPAAGYWLYLPVVMQP